MADQFFVKVLSAAVKVIRRAKDGAVVMRHNGFDQATGKPILEPATRTVFVEKGQPLPDDVADGELERLQRQPGVIGRKAAVTVVAEQPKTAITPSTATKKEPSKAPARKPAAGAKRKKKATDLGKLGGLSDKQLVKVLVDEKPGVKKLLAAVGADKELAGRVLAAERQTGSEPRTGLVTGLEKVIGAAS